MNLPRTLSRHHTRLLTNMARGETRILWNEEYGCWQFARSAITVGASKPMGGRCRWGQHAEHAVIELLQRGVLLPQGGELALSKEARKAYGTPPALPTPKHVVVMSRTRAARVQVVAESAGGES